MKMRQSVAAFGFAFITSGCVPMPRVALDAMPADREILAGEWAGEYESAALGRRGSIEFKLQGGTDEARGDVVMVPSGRRTPYQSHAYDDGQHARAMPSAEVLTINFIRASDGSLTGRLDRYWDPDRNCFADTTFSGRVALGIVEGTFKTTFDCGAGVATGTWSAKKKRAKANAAWR
jgi:hypothetical protein